MIAGGILVVLVIIYYSGFFSRREEATGMNPESRASVGEIAGPEEEEYYPEEHEVDDNLEIIE